MGSLQEGDTSFWIRETISASVFPGSFLVLTIFSEFFGK